MRGKRGGHKNWTDFKTTEMWVRHGQLLFVASVPATVGLTSSNQKEKVSPGLAVRILGGGEAD